jgi:hypothetical protein
MFIICIKHTELGFVSGLGAWSQCCKTLIYCHSTIKPSFCVIKQYYDGNYHGMAVSNTVVIYHGISTLETTGIFMTLAINYHGTLEKLVFFTTEIYHGKLPRYFYNIGPLLKLREINLNLGPEEDE